jgi:hypothetical protein
MIAMMATGRPQASHPVAGLQAMNVQSSGAGPHAGSGSHPSGGRHVGEGGRGQLGGGLKYQPARIVTPQSPPGPTERTRLKWLLLCKVLRGCVRIPHLDDLTPRALCSDDGGGSANTGCPYPLVDAAGIRVMSEV